LRRPGRRAMASVTFHGGVGEIGGNKFLVRDGDTSVMMDFGMSFAAEGRYFSEYRKARASNVLVDMLELGLLPRIDGLYRRDYAEHMGLAWTEEPPIDAIILTHAHIDHCGYLGYVREDIPVHCTRASELIMRCFDETGKGHQLTELKTKFVYKDRSRWIRLPKDTRRRDIRIMSSGKRFRVGGITVEPHEVDHSLPGACALILHTSSGTLANTADLRFHGRRARATDRFVKRCAKAGIGLLLCEGTRISKEPETPARTERWIEREAARIMRESGGLAVCGYPMRDLDRLESLHLAARAADRTLVVDLKQAYLLDLFETHLPGAYPRLDEVGIFVNRGSWGLIDKGYPDEALAKDYDGWKRDFLNHPSRLDYRDISAGAKKYLYYCDDFSLQNLIDIRPQKGSTYIRSLTEPFDADMEIQERQVKNWLAKFGLIGSSRAWHQLHVSGHGDASQIRRVIEGAGAERLVPIHTERKNEARHRAMHGRVTSVRMGRTVDV